jgi:hypothetical protein
LIEQDGEVESDSIPEDQPPQNMPLYAPPTIPSDEPAPYRHEPSPTEIEDKYQKLLKQYGLI